MEWGDEGERREWKRLRGEFKNEREKRERGERKGERGLGRERE